MATPNSNSSMENLGPRLKELRMSTGQSLREVARLLEVSPSFISQIENGKSQPSVATLYALAQLLGVAVDVLFESSLSANLRASQEIGDEIIGRSKSTFPTDLWKEVGAKISTIDPTHRSALQMALGVRWERLAATVESEVNFLEITYEPGAQSMQSGELMTHPGFEYGYALEGQIELTIGDAVLALSKGHSIGFDSSIPHKLHNTTTSVFKGIWLVHGCSAEKKD